jgi:hypothetical protein
MLESRKYMKELMKKVPQIGFEYQAKKFPIYKDVEK